MNPTTPHFCDIAHSHFGDNVRIHQGDIHYHAAPLSDSCLADLRTTDPRDDKTRIEETKGRLPKDSYRWILEHDDLKMWRKDPQCRQAKEHEDRIRRMDVNPPVGGSGGLPFYMHKNKAVASLYIWAGYGEDGAKRYRVLKGIQIIWEDNSEDFAGAKKGDMKSFHFDQGEKISRMEIWAAPKGRADAIKFETDQHNSFSHGGDGGTKHEQRIGNGVLTGFHGAAVGDIDRLGAIFGEFCGK